MLDFLTLPERTAKPRESGLTHVLDKGYSLDQVRQFMEVATDYVDIVKLGWGTAVVTPNVAREGGPVPQLRRAGVLRRHVLRGLPAPEQAGGVPRRGA